jgi:hypothetical protein
MQKLFIRGMVVSGVVFALLGQAPTTGMTLAELVKVADFVGVVRIQAVHPSPNAGLPEEQRQDWFLQTADAVVMNTIKGVDVPAHLTIHFDYGPHEQPPNILYQPDTDYFVFLAIDIPDGFSTCVQGQYAIHGAELNGWAGSASPVALEDAQTAVTKLLPR